MGEGKHKVNSNGQFGIAEHAGAMRLAFDRNDWQGNNEVISSVLGWDSQGNTLQPELHQPSPEVKQTSLDLTFILLYR